MLRSKKFNIFKHMGLNELFDVCTEDNFNYNSIYSMVLKNNYVNNVDIRVTSNYKLVKEVMLEPYILKLNDVLLIHIKENLLDDFEFLYKKSNDYVFDIYETSHPNLKDDSYITMYHVFCVSKKLQDIFNYMSFLRSNDSDKKYSCLSVFYGPCLLVNKRFDITSEVDKYNSKYKYLKTIGKGEVNNYVRSFIKSMINMANKYQDMLPPHYLKIN
jgi:hypothetical protein